MKNGFKRRLRLDGLIESVGLRNVLDDGKIKLGLVELRVCRFNFVRFLLASNSRNNRMASGGSACQSIAKEEALKHLPLAK